MAWGYVLCHQSSKSHWKHNIHTFHSFPFRKILLKTSCTFLHSHCSHYDAECGVERLEKRIDVVMDPNNPAVAGKYFSEDYVFTGSDLRILENNLKMVQNIKTSIQKQEEDAKKHLCTHFPKAGKLLPGHNHPKTFDEKLIGKLIKVKERVIEIEESLKEKLEKTSNMFQYAPHVNAKTKKRSQKENRRKAKRWKVSRKAANIQKVREFISNASASEVIQIQNLKLEALSTLSLCQVKYQQLMSEDRQLSTEAVNLISEYVDNFPRKENTNLAPDNTLDDDSNNDDDDDKDDDDIDDDADNDDNGDDGNDDY